MCHLRHRRRTHKQRQRTPNPLDPTLRIHPPHILQDPRPKPYPIKERFIRFGGDEIRRRGRVKCPSFRSQSFFGYGLEIVGGDECEERRFLVAELNGWVYGRWGFGPGFINGRGVKCTHQFGRGQALED